MPIGIIQRGRTENLGPDSALLAGVGLVRRLYQWSDMGSLRALEERAAGVMPGPECSGTERAGGVVGKLAGIALLASCLVLVGCSGDKLARLDRPHAFKSQSSNWALVMSPVSVHPLAYTTGPEISRRNESLNIRTPRATLATDRWPEDPRPNLRYSRRLYLPTSDSTYLFFDSSYTKTSRHTRRWR